MTREEAQKELAELEPKEVKLWNDYKRIIICRDSDIRRHEDAVRHIRLTTDEVLMRHNAEWLPLYTRKQQLKSFLEIAS